MGGSNKVISGYKPDESIVRLNGQLSKIVSHYKERLEEFTKQASFIDHDASINVAVALYLACYFNPNNKSCLKYTKAFDSDKNLQDFIQAWKLDQRLRLSFVKPKVQDRLRTFDSFLAYSKVLEQKDESKLRAFLKMKKFFCIPWLLASHVLFTKEDFVQNALNYNTKLRSTKRKKDGEASTSSVSISSSSSC